MPTASGPCWYAEASSRCTCPASTIRTTSIASGVVTRRPAFELRLQAQPLQLGADLRAAAVHDDRPQPGVPQENHVLREGGLQLLVDHGVAAELDDHGLAVVPGQPGQRLDEGAGLGQRGVLAGAHEEYALFSWT
ncbi:hypothetical protein SRIMM317S_03227 [Streptomyces rimosus subsp. rimosus]